jgi:ABC-type sugar transport system ATPase subunit
MALELRNVTRRVDSETHIADATLTFEADAINVLLGPTLSGKTTLLRLMAGLDRPSSGSIVMDGEDVTGVSVRRRDVAMVYQQFINYPNLTVYENIASPLRVAGRPRAVFGHMDYGKKAPDLGWRFTCPWPACPTQGHGPPRALRRPGRLRSQAQCGGRSAGVVRQERRHHRAQAQARQREAARGHRRL